jgi:hypothetical protein
LGDQIKKNELDGSCGVYEEGRGAYMILVGKLEGRRSTGRPTYRWENNIKNVSSRTRVGDMYWTDLAQERVKWQ